ncbi:MAG: aminotransferase class I/II-fold pyridoxal phosphate-dependent enzyme [Bryobacteraceae bacterium]
MSIALEARIRARLTALESDGLFRRLNPPSGIDLSSNDYLGLSADPYVISRMAAAVEREGCGSTGSRLLRGERTALSDLEKRFARWKGAEAALYFNSGYAANLAVLSTFPERGDLILSDRLNHASLIDGIRLGAASKAIFDHADPCAARRALDSAACPGHRFLVTESVFSMDGDFAPLAGYAALCRETGASLIVDEAHAIGIYGPRGTGLIEAAGIQRDVFLSICPMGKAFGVAGAFVTGAAWAIEYLVQRARPIIFSTAAPPSVAAALSAALDRIEEAPERRLRVLSLAACLRGLLADMGLPVAREGSQIIPILIGGNARAVAVASALQDDGFDVRAIRPPTVPPGAARLRVSINAGLDEAVLRCFATALAEALKKYPA